jgi:HCOMODA/2-hydroxy-3-carboxy-muconic semialdehyde decarboxylase
MSRSLAPGLVTPADVLELDFAGKPVSNVGAQLFVERFIHAEIYRARPDVNAIVHSHSPSVLPFTLVPSARLRPICHTCGFLDGLAPPFDVADHAGPANDLLIRNAELGCKFAAHLGSRAVALLRGHGFAAVGASVPNAVFRAIYTARNCDIQLAAMRLGEPIYLSSPEAVACEEAILAQASRAWMLWLSQIQAETSQWVS